MNTAEAAAIVETVAKEMGVTFDDIIGEARDAPIAKARMHAYLAIWEVCGNYSLTARLMQRHHSTVMHGVNTALAGRS